MNKVESSVIDSPLCWLKPSVLQGMLRGIEREGLRMQHNGFLSHQSHPQALGAALTHPFITTDYSEALLEFITPPQTSIAAALDFLHQLHQFTYRYLPEGERIWALSMPCMLDDQEDDIPLAQYGSSNLGRFKTLYRYGLGVRYGRRMQTIAGVHYNISFPDALFTQLQQHEPNKQLRALNAQDYRSARYFGLIRNFIRHIPMVMYLLGASPTACRCFVTGRSHHLRALNQGTLYLPDATALRMGRLGYQNTTQRSLGIRYNHLNDYLDGMHRALATVYPPFAALGVDNQHGEPIQINDHILQIENEYYSLIRPKQPPQAGETPSQALASRGVAYVELRAVDIDPYSPIGIAPQSAAFLETLALYCLLQPSPDMDDAELDAIEHNQNITVDHGRNPTTTIRVNGQAVMLRDWIAQTLTQMQPMAQLLAAAQHDTLYQDALQTMQQRVVDVSTTPSARVLHDTIDKNGTWAFGAELAEQYAVQFEQAKLSTEQSAYFEHVAAQSLIAQQQLEAEDNMTFNEYVAQYR